MIDFHSHILADIDDGSRNLETSAAMLETSRKQDINSIICTPHFYGNEERIEDFLDRRSKSLKTLLKFIEESELNSVDLFCAAEIYFFNNIRSAKDLESLTLEGTNVLFIEMPADDWRQSYVDEVARLCDRFTVILVHIERYMTGKNRRYVKELISMAQELPLYFQVNSRSIIEGKNRRKLIRMFKSGDVHFLGSDCHNMSSRPQNLCDGMNAIEKKLGKEFVIEFQKREREFLINMGLDI